MTGRKLTTIFELIARQDQVQIEDISRFMMHLHSENDTQYLNKSFIAFQDFAITVPR